MVAECLGCVFGVLLMHTSKLSRIKSKQRACALLMYAPVVRMSGQQGKLLLGLSIWHAICTRHAIQNGQYFAGLFYVLVALDRAAEWHDIGNREALSVGIH
jgi:hypothetical protein